MSRFTTRAKELFSAAKKGDPIPRLDRSVNAETLWPGSLESEADKAASILRSFFCDGFIVPYRTFAVCDQQIIRRCQGVAVFHLLRSGLGSAKADGSGVIIKRLPDGTWSGTSVILVDNKDSGLPSGVDVLDVVIVFNGKDSVDNLLDSVVALQKSVTVAAGPITENRPAPMQASAWSYAKSQGELVEIDLTKLVIREASEENERFYGIDGVSGKEILLGQVKTPSAASDAFSQTMRAITDQKQNLSGVPKPGKCPGDRRVRAPSGHHN